MLRTTLLQQSVSRFFGQVNWDARPQRSISVPMPLLRVQEFLLSIPWSGDPQELAARSLATSSVSNVPAPEEPEIALTISDLFQFF